MSASRKSDLWQLALERDGKSVKRMHKCNIHVDVQQTLWEEIKHPLRSAQHQLLSEKQRAQLDLVKHTKEFVSSVIPESEASEILNRPVTLNIDYCPSDAHGAVINLVITYKTTKPMPFEHWMLDLHLTFNKNALEPLETLEALLWTIRCELNSFWDTLEHTPIIGGFRNWKADLLPKENAINLDVSLQNCRAGFEIKEWLNSYYASQKFNSEHSLSSLDSFEPDKLGKNPSTDPTKYFLHAAPSNLQNRFELLENDSS